MRDVFELRPNIGIVFVGLVINFGMLGLGALITGILPNNIDWISIHPIFDQFTGVLLLLGGVIGLGLSLWSMDG